MQVGDVVISISGHDMGEWYIVKNVENNYIYLIDGRIRNINNPKKKQIKHVVKTNQTANQVAQKILANQYLQDAEVRKTLKFFKNNFRSE